MAKNSLILSERIQNRIHPEFMFQLTADEQDSLRSQIVTLKGKRVNNFPLTLIQFRLGGTGFGERHPFTRALAAPGPRRHFSLFGQRKVTKRKGARRELPRVPAWSDMHGGGLNYSIRFPGSSGLRNPGCAGRITPSGVNGQHDTTHCDKDPVLLFPVTTNRPNATAGSHTMAWAGKDCTGRYAASGLVRRRPPEEDNTFTRFFREKTQEN
jgi:hypothetical protein